MIIARLVSRISMGALLLAALILITAAPLAASATETEYERVAATARSKIGSDWVHYARGPNSFDCVGFVWYVFKVNDLQSHIGGYRGVKAYYNWFNERGLVAKSDPQPGDLVIWGRFKHIGLYLGDGKAISALNERLGVRIHPLKGYINMKIKAYLRTQLSR